MTKSLQTVEWMSPGANLSAYIQGVNTVPVLSADEEKALAEKLHYDGDLDAARGLVMAHLRFVVHIARSYNGYGLPLGDLIQEGNVGLMKAVKRFDPERGVRLVSFAVHWIKAEIHEYVLRNWRIVKIATTKAQRKLFFNLRSSKQKLAWLTNDEARAIADDLNVEVDQVFEMEKRLAANDSGFDAPVEDDDNAYQAPVYYLEDHSADPAKALEDADWEESNVTLMSEAMESLDDRSRDILQSRWLEEDTKVTLHDLADKYGVSAERIRQLEQNALKKLRAYMEA
ncbi:MAG: RNA polymerase sigma factor RpoH [bacterium]